MSGTVHHYKPNLRDIRFVLFELFDIGGTTLGRGPFAAMDEATALDALVGLEALCTGQLATGFAEADRTPLVLDAQGGSVTLPDALKKNIKAYYDGEWHRLDFSERLGGYGAPPTIRWAAFELVVGSHATLAFYLFGMVLARILDRVGTDAQRTRFVRNIIERRWGGTMVLTEPDAGSDVGAGKTTARLAGTEPGGAEIWEISGVKRFITNGDFDAAENIVHLVLARPEGAGPGTKGLSMFIVPKFWVNPDGTLGERNGAYCTKVEKKMGLKASATCEMTFGDRRPARGLLVGDRHDGIRQMFEVIEQARLGIGVKSMSTLSTAYLNALAFAKERVQGPDLSRATDKASPRVRIIEHADVRRMLMAQKAHVEGMRALCFFAAHVQDQVDILGGHGSPDAAALDQLNDLLLPLIKGYCSEKAYELLAVSLQCFGGSGFCQDYPIEQYIRDQKIDSLYEGTTHIQALDLFLRKIARDGGVTLRGLLARVKGTLDAEEGGAALARERAHLGRALTDVEAIFGAMMAKAQESLHHVGLQANRILFTLAELVIAWLHVRSAALAFEQLEGGASSERDFYAGKVAAARWFCANVCPGARVARELVEGGTLDLMGVAEASF
jgi:alkylation response protein AidB-like acyl-CoA dehydrogenase